MHPRCGLQDFRMGSMDLLQCLWSFVFVESVEVFGTSCCCCCADYICIFDDDDDDDDDGIVNCDGTGRN